jgi:hypothetical protein
VSAPRATRRRAQVNSRPEPHDSSSGEPIQLDLGAVKETSVKEYAIRFAFGAAISMVAGLVSLRFGALAGGLFLAFPAILPASLTLVEDKETTERASADIKGGIIGGIGLVAFALAGGLLVRRSPAAALAAATTAWLLVSVSLYFVLRRRWVFRDA